MATRILHGIDIFEQQWNSTQWFRSRCSLRIDGQADITGLQKLTLSPWIRWAKNLWSKEIIALSVQPLYNAMFGVHSLWVEYVINELCYKGTILQRNSFINFHGNKIGSHNICLFDLILYVSVNNFSVMSGRVFLEARISVSCSMIQLSDTSEAQTPTPWSLDKHFTTELCAPLGSQNMTVLLNPYPCYVYALVYNIPPTSEVICLKYHLTDW